MKWPILFVVGLVILYIAAPALFQIFWAGFTAVMMLLVGLFIQAAKAIATAFGY